MKKWNRYLIDRFALPWIRKEAKDNKLIEHYLGEQKLHEDKEPDQDIIDLLSLLSIQEHKGKSILPFLRTFNKSARLQITSPLTFGLDEWVEETVENSVRQNSRLSSVFNYYIEGSDADAPDIYVDVDSITWVTLDSYYDISLKTTVKSESPYKSINGTCFVYDKDSDKFAPVWSGNIIENTTDFMGENQCKCECLEIRKSKDDTEPFCYITLKSKIPRNFYKDYILTDVRKLKSLPDDSYEEELKWCMSNRDKLIELLL